MGCKEFGDLFKMEESVINLSPFFDESDRWQLAKRRIIISLVIDFINTFLFHKLKPISIIQSRKLVFWKKILQKHNSGELVRLGHGIYNKSFF